MECEFPTTNANNEEITAIFKEVKTVAVAGLSPNESKPSHFVPKYLQDAGYKIYPIYPKEDEIMGEKVYRSLAEIEESIDMVVVFRKPDAVPAILDAVLAKGDVKVLWLQQGIVHNESANRATKAGLRVVQNKCTMVEHRAHA
jgi:predicted CoA-binding protein